MICTPNPFVECTIVVGDHRVHGQTQVRGGPHAEIMALRAAQAQGLDVRAAVVHVSLEPCAHHGRTPPCTSALIAAGVGKVVIAALDPNPLVAGKGAQQLRDAGIEVHVLDPDHPLALASRERNIGFFSRMVRHRPWVRMKAAASLDGVTALANGQSQWITGPAARADGQTWRAKACAVLTGVGTIRTDDPLLNVREPILTDSGPISTPRQPHIVVVDSKLETPLTARFLDTLGQRGEASSLYPQETVDAITARRGLIYHASCNEDKIRALEARGIQLIHVPEADTGKVDLAAMLRDLAQKQEINELHVEAGFKLNGSLLRAGLVDEVLMYLAPCVLGSGMGVAMLPAPLYLGNVPPAQQLEFLAADLIGNALQTDVRIRARIRNSMAF